LNRWQYEGHETDVPRALYNDVVGNSAFSTRWIEDGSYLRVKNITIAYSVPHKIFFLRNAQVFATVTNLYTRSKYLGYDPEFSYSPSSFVQGVDYAQAPMCRSFIVGVKFGL
jgi:hypothetical protein